jgi:hypothetical protein
MRIPVSIRTSYFMADKRALVDSGATDNFMHPNFATKMGLGMKELPTPRKIFNIDNTTNKSGKITHYLDLDVYTKGIHREMRFLITDIGSEDILLGYPWLASFEPKFSWRHAVIDERVLPVVISSVNPRIIRQRAGNRCNIIRRRENTHSPHTRITVNHSRSINRTSNSSRTEPSSGRSPKGIRTIRQTIQQRSIVPIPTVKAMGSCYRFQTNGPRRTPLQSVPYDTRRGQITTQIPAGTGS